MKVTLFLSSLWLFIASLFAPSTENTFLSGIVTDGRDPLVGATVKVMRGTDLVKSSLTDYNGQYKIELQPDTYTVEFCYTGYQCQKIIQVKVIAQKTNDLSVMLTPASVLDEVVITEYQTRRKDYDKSSSGMTISSEEITTRDVAAVKATTTGAPKEGKPATYAGSAGKKAKAPSGMAKPAPSEDVKIRGSRTTPTDYYIDGIRVHGEAPTVADMEEEVAAETKEPVSEPAVDGPKSLKDDEITDGRMPAQPAPRAGLLTAGEWNDLHNWNRHWVDLLADGETDSYQKMYSFYPRQRYTVMVTNDNGYPIADAVTQLKTAAGILIWEARTDNTGKAELWAGLFSPEKEAAILHAEVWMNGQKHEIAPLKPASEGFNNLKIMAECNAPKNVDIVWAVDATGSMGDEIDYLKTELLDVIGRAKSRNPELAFRMGTVFYRDRGDEYITKSSGLSSDIPQTVSFIQNQFAGGGGDFPEAVHSALEEAIFSQKWSDNAIARICFLVLDASPHQEPEVIASLQKSIREAARKGIRIVPVTASGIQKDTEFLMKFFGLATNGTYVFLTDHSGIGGKHLEPTTDEYKVEPLNNLLVRLITEYTSIETCEGKSEIRFENDPQQQPGPIMHALYYPNPATDQFTLELPFEVQSVTIYDSEGKAVRKIEKPVAGPNTVAISDLAAGFYTIRISNNGLMQSGKLMVVRS